MNSKTNNSYSAKAFKTCTNSAVSYSVPRQKVVPKKSKSELVEWYIYQWGFLETFLTHFLKWFCTKITVLPTITQFSLSLVKILGILQWVFRLSFSSGLFSLVSTFSCTAIFVTANSNPLPLFTLLHGRPPGGHTVLQGSLTNQQWGLKITLTEKDKEKYSISTSLHTSKLSLAAMLLRVHQHPARSLESLTWTCLCSPTFSSAHLLCCVPPFLSLSVSEPCLHSELLSSLLISSDLGGGREWGEARLYPNPFWITAACGSQSWATITPTIDPVHRVGAWTSAFLMHQWKCIGDYLLISMTSAIKER